MDEKKNVSFVSGLALILSALALLLIGIIQITATPYTDTMEQIIDTKLNALENRMDVKLESGLKKLAKAEDEAAIRELRSFEANLNNWLAVGPGEYTEKVQAIKTQIDALIQQMEAGKGKAGAAAPAVKTEAPKTEPPAPAK